MYNRVIVTLDGSVHAECALPHAESLARGLGVPLVLLQVVPYPEVRDAAVESDWEEVARKYLEPIAERLKGEGIDARVEILWGKVEDKIVEYAEADPDSLLVISTHGRTGLARLAFGSVTEAVLRRVAAIPVVVCRCMRMTSAS